MHPSNEIIPFRRLLDGYIGHNETYSIARTAPIIHETDKEEISFSDKIYAMCAMQFHWPKTVVDQQPVKYLSRLQYTLKKELETEEQKTKEKVMAKEYDRLYNAEANQIAMRDRINARIKAAQNKKHKDG